MIYFLYGEDSYRSKRKLEEIVEGHKKVHKSGLNLIYINAEETTFDDFYNNFKITSMFAEKKLIVLKDVFKDKNFQEKFLDNIKNIEKIKDIVVIHEENLPDQRTKFFKALNKKSGEIKSQNFIKLTPAEMRKWVAAEFIKNKLKADSAAIDLLVNFIGSDLWRASNEINKLSNYKRGGTVIKEDVVALVKADTENDIFKTIEALASKNKKLALSLFHQHLDSGDNALYLLSMITYQFRNILIIKELQGNVPYGFIAGKTGLHPFVVQKTYYLCDKFSMSELKKIYQKIFQVDSEMKTGQIEPETALDLLLTEI